MGQKDPQKAASQHLEAPSFAALGEGSNASAADDASSEEHHFPSAAILGSSTSTSARSEATQIPKNTTITPITTTPVQARESLAAAGPRDQEVPGTVLGSESAASGLSSSEDKDNDELESEMDADREQEEALAEPDREQESEPEHEEKPTKRQLDQMEQSREIFHDQATTTTTTTTTPTPPTQQSNTTPLPEAQQKLKSVVAQQTLLAAQYRTVAAKLAEVLDSRLAKNLKTMDKQDRDRSVQLSPYLVRLYNTHTRSLPKNHSAKHCRMRDLQIGLISDLTKTNARIVWAQFMNDKYKLREKMISKVSKRISELQQERNIAGSIAPFETKDWIQSNIDTIMALGETSEPTPLHVQEITSDLAALKQLKVKKEKAEIDLDEFDGMELEPDDVVEPEPYEQDGLDHLAEAVHSREPEQVVPPVQVQVQVQPQAPQAQVQVQPVPQIQVQAAPQVQAPQMQEPQPVPHMQEMQPLIQGQAQPVRLQTQARKPRRTYQLKKPARKYGSGAPSNAESWVTVTANAQPVQDAHESPLRRARPSIVPAKQEPVQSPLAAHAQPYKGPSSNRRQSGSGRAHVHRKSSDAIQSPQQKQRTHQMHPSPPQPQVYHNDVNMMIPQNPQGPASKWGQQYYPQVMPYQQEYSMQPGQSGREIPPGIKRPRSRSGSRRSSIGQGIPVMLPPLPTPLQGEMQQAPSQQQTPVHPSPAHMQAPLMQPPSQLSAPTQLQGQHIQPSNVGQAGPEGHKYCSNQYLPPIAMPGSMPAQYPLPGGMMMQPMWYHDPAQVQEMPGHQMNPPRNSLPVYGQYYYPPAESRQ